MKLGRLRAAALLLPIFAAACATTPRSTSIFTPQQVSTLRANNFVETERGWEFSANDKLLFAFDESTLKPDKIPAIRAIAARLNAVEITHATVEGHTDSIGNEHYNNQLSLRRASAVAEAFVSGGFSRAGLKVEGLGARFPVESNATRQSREENRRVVILVSAP